MLRPRLVRGASVDDIDTLVAFFIAPVFERTYTPICRRRRVYIYFCHLEHVLIEILRRVYINSRKTIRVCQWQVRRGFNERPRRTVITAVQLNVPRTVRIC